MYSPILSTLQEELEKGTDESSATIDEHLEEDNVGAAGTQKSDQKTDLDLKVAEETEDEVEEKAEESTDCDIVSPRVHRKYRREILTKSTFSEEEGEAEIELETDRNKERDKYAYVYEDKADNFGCEDSNTSIDDDRNLKLPVLNILLRATMFVALIFPFLVAVVEINIELDHNIDDVLLSSASNKITTSNKIVASNKSFRRSNRGSGNY